MGTRGPKKGWADKLRSDAGYWEECFNGAHASSKRLYARIIKFNTMTKWQKVVFILKGGWV